jgi:hypothetical protein
MYEKMFSVNRNRIGTTDRNHHLRIFPRESQKFLQKVVLVCHVEVIVVLAYKGPEMDFFNSILVEISGHKLEFCLVFSTLIFPFYKMLSMNRPVTRVFFFRKFFARIFKAREEYDMVFF